MIFVAKRFPDEDLESLLRRLKRKCKQDQIFIKLKEREFFVRPGEKKRLKKRRKKFTDGTEIAAKKH